MSCSFWFAIVLLVGCCLVGLGLLSSCPVLQLLVQFMEFSVRPFDTCAHSNLR